MFNTKSVSAENSPIMEATKKSKTQFINCLIEKVHGVDFNTGWASFRVLKTGRNNPRNIFIDDTAIALPSKFTVTLRNFEEDVINSLSAGTLLRLSGNFINNHPYGIQLIAEDLAFVFPETDDEIERFISSNRLIKSVIKDDLLKQIILQSKRKNKSLNLLLSSVDNLRDLYIPELDDGKCLDIAYTWNFLRFERSAIDYLRNALSVDISELELKRIFRFFTTEYDDLISLTNDNSDVNDFKSSVHFFSFMKGYRQKYTGKDERYTSSSKPFVFNEAFTEEFAKNFIENVLSFIRKYPYFLMNGERINFTIADKWAKELKLNINDDERYNALTIFVINLLADQSGDTAIPRNTLISGIQKYEKSLSYNDVREILSRQMKQWNIFLRTLSKDKGGELTPHYTYKNTFIQELKIAQKIKDMINCEKIFSDNDIARIEKRLNDPSCILDESQKTAVRAFFSNNFSIMTGGPGTGKTTTIQNIVRLIFDELEGFSVYLLAPTGIASKRIRSNLSEEFAYQFKTEQLLCGTIHSEMYKSQYSNSKSIISSNKVVYIIDESSMLDNDLFYRFTQYLETVQKKLPDIKLCLSLVGDINQLPPVSKGQVMRDLLSFHEQNDELDKPNYSLTYLQKIHRTSNKSMIAENAAKIIQGIVPDTKGVLGEDDYVFLPTKSDEETMDTIKDSVCRLINEFGYKKEDIQFIIPQSTGDVGENKLNEELRWYLNTSFNLEEAESNKLVHQNVKLKTLLYGDRVMFTKNHKDNYGKQDLTKSEKNVFNGEIGYVINNPDLSKELEVDLSDRIVKFTNSSDQSIINTTKLAYAITVHKSQGSESPVIVMPISAAHHYMLINNLIYTGVTRAKKLLLLIGDEKAYAKGIKRMGDSLRRTGLCYELITDFNENRQKLLESVLDNFKSSDNNELIDEIKIAFIVNLNKHLVRRFDEFDDNEMFEQGSDEDRQLDTILKETSDDVDAFNDGSPMPF